MSLVTTVARLFIFRKRSKPSIGDLEIFERRIQCLEDESDIL